MSIAENVKHKTTNQNAMSVKSPEEFFGHEMGADRKMAKWDKIVEYFWQLDELPTMYVRELGKTTEGHPFLLAAISSPRKSRTWRRYVSSAGL